MTHYLKHLLLYTSIALIAACGSQESVNTDKSTDLAGVNTASVASKTVATQATETAADIAVASTSPKIPSKDLLTNLALAYPGGALPAERAAAAAAELAQNPAALKFNASSTTINSQAGAITPQAATTYTVGLSAPVQRAQNTTLFGSYFFSIYDFEMVNALATHPTWNLEGTAFHASLGLNPGLAPVYRFRNIINGSYLYTINEPEKDNIIANYSATFILEGVAWYASPVPATGFSPLYRFRNLTNGTYLFSAYETEKDAIVANYSAIFLLEGISYYVRQTAPLELSVVAGSGTSGNADGSGAAAQMNRIFGMAQVASGNIYATNLGNHTIRQITPSGAVNTYAGLPGTSGSADGSLAAARFSQPIGMVRDSSGFLFVSELNNHTIRRISASDVSTFAGLAGAPGSTDATGGAARFNQPAGMAIDTANNIYLADSSNHTIRKITPAGVVSTIAGTAGSPAFVNATGAAARFNSPAGIAIDTLGNLFVADISNNVIRKITPAGAVSTFAGSSIGTAGTLDGTGTSARFAGPIGITIDTANNLYVTDRNNHTVRKITPAAVVSTVVGTSTTPVPPFAEGLLPSSLGNTSFAHSVRVFGSELYIGTDSRLLKVNGLP
jgi:sugar lactone lactonase YvrE